MEIKNKIDTKDVSDTEHDVISINSITRLYTDKIISILEKNNDKATIKAATSSFARITALAGLLVSEGTIDVATFMTELDRIDNSVQSAIKEDGAYHGKKATH